MSRLPIVLVDGRMIGPVFHGFARYVERLAAGLSELDRSVRLSYEPVFLTQPGRRELHGFRTIECSVPMHALSELWVLRSVIARSGATLYHSPTFSSVPLCPIPWVQTIHDLNHLQHGSVLQRLYYQRVLKPFAAHSRALVAVSQTTRKEVAKWLEREESTLSLAYNAIDPEWARPQPAPPSFPSQGYFFCLSNPKPHKNVGTLVASYQEYRLRATRERQEPLPLVLSFEGFRDVPGVSCVPGLSDPEARSWVAHARAVCFPSLYEGFGLPPVEAACSGVPVLVSEIPPHREGLCEFGAEGVVWVAPLDHEGWVSALAQAAQGKVLPPSRESAQRTFGRYSARQLALVMDQIYRRVLGEAS